MKEQLIRILGEKNLLIDEPLKNHTTFKIGGNADFVALPENKEEVSLVIDFLKKEKADYAVIGNGSNILAKDEGYRGVVVKLENLKDITVSGSEITVGAGVILSKIAKVALENSLKGFEELSGIPGSLGGAIYMNAGAYNREISEVLKSVTYLDDNGEIVTKNINELEMAYRKTTFTGKHYVILEAVIQLEAGEYDKIKENMREVTHKRVSKQPLEFPSAGSTFKRPKGNFAGKLIEDSGLKGYTIGGARVSEKHAGFVINTGNATFKDVIELTDHIKKVVKENYQVDLELEVVIL